MSQTLTQIGKYRIERELGRGAMGVVYKAFDPVVERLVAIKTIRLDVEDAQELVNRLKREAKSVGQLEHPNIVTLYDAGESGGVFYLAMQFVQGETLHDRINRQRWFALKDTQDIFRQICAGLDYAHQRGVIHRDIKPANIMITPDGVVKLTDFGIAKLAGAGTTSTGLVVGTPSYMSPEQALGKPLDGRSDIFSLGSILYELMTGEKAFPGQNVTTVMYKIVHETPTPLAALQPGLDPAVEAIVLKALAKHPDQRFQTCRELSGALELYINRAIGAMPKTSVAVAPPIGPMAAVVPPPTPAPAPSTLPVAPAVVPTSSASVAPVALPGPATAAQPATGHTGIPLAWLGGGVLGTLLLVILILLVVQMRQPTTVMAPGPTPAASSPQPSAPANPPVTAAQPAPAQQATIPVVEQPPAASPKPAAVDSPPSHPAPAAAPRRVVAARETRALARPTREEVQPPAPTWRPVPGTTAPVKPSTAEPLPEAPAEPETFDAAMLKGDLAFQSSDYQKALAAYLKAYRLNPASRSVKMKLRTVLTLLGRPEDAQKYR